MQAVRQESSYDANEYALAFQRGEEKGFDFFFRQLFPSLCFFANSIVKNRHSAEDIASSAFIKIWKKHAQFSTFGSIRAYLYQIVRNDCFTVVRQNQRAATAQKEVEYLAMADREDDCVADIIRAEFLGELYRAMNGLPAECKRIFRMLYIQGKTVKEISKELNLSTSTIKTQKARGLTVLRKIISPLLFFLFLSLQ